ncbi:MAG: hypothetical protein L3J66_10140 [Bacteroidales bacterium]|nr:hypothetical protein [Bacteroidales bacterium]
MKRFLIISIGILLLGGNSFAQDSKPGRTQFMVRGYGHAGLDYLKTPDGTSLSYVGAAFSPIFIFKQGSRFLFEAELEFQLDQNQLDIGLEYANLMFVINKYLMVRGGKFLLPFGTFMERLHPAWVNRLSSKPLGFGHDGIAPSSGIGIELRGSAPIGGTTINYSVYSTNGPRLKDGSEEPDEAGMLNFENYIDNNINKAIGGRIGYLPLYNSSMELGVSFYTAKVGDKGSVYENVRSTLWAFDFSYVKQISPIKGVLDLKAQYNQTQVSDAYYLELEEDRDTIASYTFDNFSRAYYAQLSYRPSMSGNNFLKNIEFVSRYSKLNTPEGSEWESNADELSFGLNYWISWRQVLKLNYSFINSEGGHDATEGAGKQQSNTLFVQWAIGF